MARIYYILDSYTGLRLSDYRLPSTDGDPQYSTTRKEAQEAADKLNVRPQVNGERYLVKLVSNAK